jgi:EpsI family protein
MTWKLRGEAGLAWLLLLVAIAPTLTRTARSWSTPNAEHGPLIVVACGWLAWRARDVLRRTSSVARPWAGGAALLLVLWIGDAATLEPHVTIAGPVALLAVAAHVVARHGLGVLRVLWFPLAFGLFALPAPGPTVFALSVRLKLLATQLSELLLDSLGLAVVRVGATLHVPGATIAVDDGCSGLRGLMAIVAFGVYLAYVSTSRRRGLAALVAAVPAAIAANVVRIVAIILLVARGHEEVLEGSVHEATGLAVYALAIGLVLAINGRIGRCADEEATPAVDPLPPAPPSPPLARAWLMSIVALFAGLASVPAPGASPSVANRLPERLGEFSGATVPLPPIVFEALGNDVAARRYVIDDPSRPLDVVVIHSVDDPWRAYHPPDSCFLIGGWEIAEQGERALAGVSARRRLFRRGQDAELVYYWVRVGARPVSDERSLRVELFRNRFLGARRTGATLIRLSTSVRQGDVADAERRVTTFAAGALEPLQAALEPRTGRH